MFVQNNNKQDNNNQNQQNANTNQPQQPAQQVEPTQTGQLDQSLQASDESLQRAQTTDQTQEDYVNSYEPPPKQTNEASQAQGAAQSVQPAQPDQSVQPEQTPSQPQEAEMPQQPQEPQTSQQQQSVQPSESQQPAQPVESKQPQQSEENQANEAKQKNLVSEKLEDQNIFFLLGVQDGTAEEKERFLDELQQVIWEDFLENDLELLITTQEKEQVDQILNNSDLSDLDKQEQILNYLSNLIPDLEEIMLEKALELKQEMVKERVEGMRQYYADKEEALSKIDQAAQMFAQGKWSSGAKLLNQVV